MRDLKLYLFNSIMWSCGKYAARIGKDASNRNLVLMGEIFKLAGDIQQSISYMYALILFHETINLFMVLLLYYGT